METVNQLQEEFIKNASYRMDESLRMIKICLDQLSDEVIWKKPNASTNSIGNLILHLCGNITQYGIASLKHQKDQRNRDDEFTVSSGYDRTALLQKLKTTVEEAKSTFGEVPVSELLMERSVQGFTFSGIGNIVHVVEHFSYHTGQIALWTKILNNKDLGFYSGIDLTVKNE